MSLPSAWDDLRWPWVLPVVAGVLLVLLLWWSRRPRTRSRADDLVVAGTAALRALPRYRALRRRQRWVGLLLTAGALIVAGGASLALARPQVVEDEPRAPRNRDIMLCLDASASMDADNLAVVRAMRTITTGLGGDRIGMMIWSGSALLVFPLTDDAAYVRTQLDRAEAAFDGEPGGFFAGLDATDSGASLIGDGIVSCVDRFDRAGEDRTRAVITSSDNDPVGPPVYPLASAATYAEEHDVRVYGIGARSLSAPDREAARTELADATRATGGTLVLLGQDGGADALVDRIDELEQARAAEPPRRVTRDTPDLGVRVAAVGLALLVVAWLLQGARRLRRRSAR